jgi:hypothetical protein
VSRQIGYKIGEGLRDELREIVIKHRSEVGSLSGPTRKREYQEGRQPRVPAASSTIRLAQTSGEWPNEPPRNVKAVQLFTQPADPSGPADWIPETDEYGDPVIAVTINWFTHVPVGQGDVIKWCAVVPISDLEGEYDTGQVISSIDAPDQPIMKPYGKLWLLLAVEC